MSYNKHLENNLKRDDSRDEYVYTHKTVGKAFFYEYNLMYNDLQNSYLSLVEELAFCKANDIKSRARKITHKIKKMKTEYPEMLLVL